MPPWHAALHTSTEPSRCFCKLWTHVNVMTCPYSISVLSTSSPWQQQEQGRHSQISQTFMNSYSKSCQNSFCSRFKMIDLISSPLCTCHDSSAVVTCAKLWPDLVIIFHVISTCNFTRFELWAHKLFVRWVSGTQYNWIMIKHSPPQPHRQTHPQLLHTGAHFNSLLSQRFFP